MFGRLLTVSVIVALLSVGGAAAQDAPADTAAATTPAEALPESVPAGMAPTDTALAPPDTTMAPVPPVTAPGPGDVVIYGRVTDANSLPMAAISVNLFIAGLEEQSAVTDTSGTFSMTHDLDLSADETVVLWFTPPRGMGFVRELVVLKESAASAAGRHYGPCISRATLSDSTFVEAQILDQASYAKKIEDSGCMDMVAPTGPSEFELTYNLPAGQVFSITTTSSQSLSEGGDSEAVTTDWSAAYSVTVDSTSAAGLALTLEYTDAKISSAEAPSLADIDFSPLLGQKASLFLSSVGELSRFAGFESLPVISLGPGGSLNSERHINELRTLLPTLPAGPVGRGDTWTKDHRFQQSIPGGAGNVTISFTYTLGGPSMYKGSSCVEIDSEYTFTFSGESEIQGAPFAINMEGSGTEKIYFSYERGMMLGKTGQSKTSGATESRGMSFPMEEETESTVEIVLQ